MSLEFPQGVLPASSGEGLIKPYIMTRANVSGALELSFEPTTVKDEVPLFGIDVSMQRNETPDLRQQIAEYTHPRLDYLRECIDDDSMSARLVRMALEGLIEQRRVRKRAQGYLIGEVVIDKSFILIEEELEKIEVLQAGEVTAIINPDYNPEHRFPRIVPANSAEEYEGLLKDIANANNLTVYGFPNTISGL